MVVTMGLTRVCRFVCCRWRTREGGVRRDTHRQLSVRLGANALYYEYDYSGVEGCKREQSTYGIVGYT